MLKGGAYSKKQGKRQQRNVLFTYITFYTVKIFSAIQNDWGKAFGLQVKRGTKNIKIDFLSIKLWTKYRMS